MKIQIYLHPIKEKSPISVEKEKRNPNKVFYLERDYYSNPQVVVVTATNKKEATKLLDILLKEENYSPGNYGKLKELDTSSKKIQIISPPGDRHLVR